MEASSAITDDERTLISWLDGEPVASISDDLVASSARLQGVRKGRAAAVSTATDGYTVVFALVELDPTLGNTQVVLADSQDGQPLHASDEPWRLVVPGDQRAARSVRQVTSIRVSE